MISFEFVAENFDELEADFQREYGIDLREALYGDSPIGGRRLSALIEGLSPESTTMRKLMWGDQPWSTTNELLASLVESVDLTNRLLYISGHFKGEVWEPLHIKRPYLQAPKEEKQVPDIEEARSFFGTMAASSNVVVDSFDAADSSGSDTPGTVSK